MASCQCLDFGRCQKPLAAIGSDGLSILQTPTQEGEGVGEENFHVKLMISLIKSITVSVTLFSIPPSHTMHMSWILIPCS